MRDALPLTALARRQEQGFSLVPITAEGILTVKSAGCIVDDTCVVRTVKRSAWLKSAKLRACGSSSRERHERGRECECELHQRSVLQFVGGRSGIMPF